MKIRSDKKSNSPATYIVGFSGSFYCLWYRTEAELDWDGQWCINYRYIKRLSTDLNKAKELATAEVGDFIVDETLQGTKWEIEAKVIYEDYQFPYGMKAGQDIRTCDDVWQLNRLRQDSVDAVRQDFAMKRLIELNELVKYKGEWHTKEGLVYAKEQAKRERKKTRIANLETGHHYDHGQKIEHEVKLMDQFSFEGMYGTTYIQIFSDNKRRKFQYMGSSPVDICEGKKKTVSCSIKLNNYNGENQTMMQRIKIINQSIQSS